MKLMRAILGDRLFVYLMKQTFYGHFVAGEDRIRIVPTLTRCLYSYQFLYVSRLWLRPFVMRKRMHSGKTFHLHDDPNALDARLLLANWLVHLFVILSSHHTCPALSLPRASEERLLWREAHVCFPSQNSLFSVTILCLYVCLVHVLFTISAVLMFGP